MLKLGKGLSPFPFPPIPRDVATSEAARFLCLCDRSELENGRADGAGTDFDYAVLITRNVWQSLAYSPLGAVVITYETHPITDHVSAYNSPTS